MLLRTPSARNCAATGRRSSRAPTCRVLSAQLPSTRCFAGLSLICRKWIGAILFWTMPASALLSVLRDLTSLTVDFMNDAPRKKQLNLIARMRKLEHLRLEWLEVPHETFWDRFRLPATLRHLCLNVANDCPIAESFLEAVAALPNLADMCLFIDQNVGGAFEERLVADPRYASLIPKIRGLSFATSCYRVAVQSVPNALLRHPELRLDVLAVQFPNDDEFFPDKDPDFRQTWDHICRTFTLSTLTLIHACTSYILLGMPRANVLHLCDCYLDTNGERLTELKAIVEKQTDQVSIARQRPMDADDPESAMWQALDDRGPDRLKSRWGPPCALQCTGR
ncbi:hypothetical protein DFJ74DRAFT_664936 [Hyaloraphidium curvatum]|nr:hypothetical protein DFJ74DRAFT_664936 [Hyaloraphidium curvatum]